MRSYCKNATSEKRPPDFGLINELVNDYYTESTNEEILGFSWHSFSIILQYKHKKHHLFKEKRENGQIQKKTYQTLEKCSVAKQKMASEMNERTATTQQTFQRCFNVVVWLIQCRDVAQRQIDVETILCISALEFTMSNNVESILCILTLI